jgi:aldose 1-epimerase
MPPETSPVKFLPLGAIIQEFEIGKRNITLGFPRQTDYETVTHPYYGETIGRIPNRISNGVIKNVNGRDYSLAQNERDITTLHGGVKGWGTCIWGRPKQIRRDGRGVLEFTLKSPNGDEGFPGEVEARI